MPKLKPTMTITQTELRARPAEWARYMESHIINVVRDGTNEVCMSMSTGSYMPRSLWERIKDARQAVKESFYYQ